MTVTIRPALPAEASRLTTLAIASKAVWGYDDAFMCSCRQELTLAATDFDTAAFVVELQGEIAGFYTLDHVDDEQAELGYLFVAPERMREGLGARLMRHACDTAVRLGYTRLVIVGDPHAEDFYLAMGAVRAGQSPSASVPGRMLPLFHILLPTTT